MEWKSDLAGILFLLVTTICSSQGQEMTSTISSSEEAFVAAEEGGFRGPCRTELDTFERKDAYMNYTLMWQMISFSDNATLEECESRCLANCRCDGFKWQPTGNETGCLFFEGLEWDTVKWGYSTYDTFYAIVPNKTGTIQFPPATPPRGGRRHTALKKTWILVILIVLASLTLVILLLGTLHLLRSKEGCTSSEEIQVHLEENDDVEKGMERNTTKTSQILRIASKLKKGKKSYDGLDIFSYETLLKATDQFSRGSKLGEGGFGAVYKGILHNGHEIAVKRLSNCSGQGVAEFKNEIKVIRKLQHKNLVRLLGCCIHGDEKLLVYEYLPNKSLDYFLFDRSKKELLGWQKRFSIIEGIAEGLLYLHKCSRVKGNFSEKSDVFSFGVIILEILSGRKSTSFSGSNGAAENLIGYAWDLWKEGKGLKLMDKKIGACSDNMFLRHIHVALLCVQESARDRPKMFDVIHMLKNGKKSLPAPKQLGFCFGKTEEDRDLFRKVLNCFAPMTMSSSSAL